MGIAESPIVLRNELAERLRDARARSDELFAIVRSAAITDRPIPERHRIIFYLGHLEAFDWNLIALRGFAIEPFHPAFDKLFAFGIDPVGGGLPNDMPSDWPSVAEIRQYNQHVRDTVDACLEKADLADHRQPLLEGGRIFHVAIEHRLMHAETLAYMLHQLPLDRKIAQPRTPAPHARLVPEGMVAIPEGTAQLGLRRADATRFGWDNEYEAHTVRVPAFRIDMGKVTNAQFIEFLRAGGYDERRLWGDDDWAWRVENRIEHPAFWRRGRDGSWLYRGMFEEIPLPLDWPVYVSHAEASAYARWLGKALPSEAQFHRAAHGAPDGRAREYPWGEEPPEPHHGNFDFARWDPAPVGAFPDGRSAFGVADLVGNGWEWTSTLFAPFEGFEAFPFYPGYSADFFDGKHHVMKGGSARTAACLLRRSFRNWFQPRYQYVYAGFRCVDGPARGTTSTRDAGERPAS